MTHQKIAQSLGFFGVAVVLALMASGFVDMPLHSPSSAIPERRDFPINAQISPCQDFYQHACSKVNESFKLREDRVRHVFSFDDSRERLLEAKKKYLAAGTQSPPQSERGRLLRDIYLACMNEDGAKQDERQLTQGALQSIAKLRTRADLQKWLGSRIVSRDRGFLGLVFLSNLTDPSQLDIAFLPDLQRLPERSYYDNSELMAEYESVLVSFFQSIGRDNAADRAHKVLEVEKRFAQTFPLPAEIRDLVSEDTHISRAELLKLYPNLRLTPLLKRIPLSTVIRNLTPDSLAFLNQALADTDLETLKDLFLVQQLADDLDDAYPEFFQKQFNFRFKHLGGPKTRSSREERCTQLVMSDFDRELDAELLPQLFPDFPAAKFKTLTEKLRAAIIDGLQHNTWLSEQGREGAIRKIKNAQLMLVKPEREEDWGFNLPARYSNNRPLSNRRLHDWKDQEKYLAKLGKPVNRNEWDMGPLTVNAEYSAAYNQFVMPIGILQYPFYDPNLADEVNLGAVGTVIGHELGHGIDDEGSKFDDQGRKRAWMTDGDLHTFGERTAKLIAQFDQIGHNGHLTLGENIGDLVGLTFAFRAAFPNGQGSVDEKRTFFYQYARLWCTVQLPKSRESQLKTNPHSLGEARVNQQVRQQKEFAEAFQCRPGDPMTLSDADRVIVW